GGGLVSRLRQHRAVYRKAELGSRCAGTARGSRGWSVAPESTPHAGWASGDADGRSVCAAAPMSAPGLSARQSFRSCSRRCCSILKRVNVSRSGGTEERRNGGTEEARVQNSSPFLCSSVVIPFSPSPPFAVR